MDIIYSGCSKHSNAFNTYSQHVDVEASVDVLLLFVFVPDKALHCSARTSVKEEQGRVDSLCTTWLGSSKIAAQARPLSWHGLTHTFSILVEKVDTVTTRILGSVAIAVLASQVQQRWWQCLTRMSYRTCADPAATQCLLWGFRLQST